MSRPDEEGTWWSLIDVTLIGSGRLRHAEVCHPGEFAVLRDPEHPESQQYWYMQLMNMLNSLVCRIGTAHVRIDIAYVPDFMRDVIRSQA